MIRGFAVLAALIWSAAAHGQSALIVGRGHMVPIDGVIGQPMTDDERAAAICQRHIDPTQTYATSPPMPVYDPKWLVCEKVDLEKARRDREKQDADDMRFLQGYTGSR